MFGLFKQKKSYEKVEEETKKSFEVVKKDIEKMNSWVFHLNTRDEILNTQINDLKQEISTLHDEIEQVKDVVSMFGESVSKQLFKTPVGRLNKQTAVHAVQTPVQTPVQTGNFYGFSNLSSTERAIIWVLANSELRLSYDDLGAMLGKTRSTIRGQINSIKQKSEGLILEYTEQNGKKRVYIPEEIKEKIIRNIRVKIKKEKNRENER